MHFLDHSSKMDREMSPEPLGRGKGNQKQDLWHLASFKEIAKPLSSRRKKPGTSVPSKQTEGAGPVARRLLRWGDRPYALLPRKDIKLPAQAFPFPEPEKTEQSCFATVQRNIQTGGKLILLSIPHRANPHCRPHSSTTRNSDPEVINCGVVWIWALPWILWTPAEPPFTTEGIRKCLSLM